MKNMEKENNYATPVLEIIFIETEKIMAVSEELPKYEDTVIPQAPPNYYNDFNKLKTEQ